MATYQPNEMCMLVNVAAQLAPLIGVIALKRKAVKDPSTAPEQNTTVFSQPSTPADGPAIHLVAPADAADEDVLEMVKALVRKADRLHRSLGGQGLTVDSIEIRTAAAIPAEVPP